MLHDLRYAFRLLAKHPGQTLLAVITLSLGIGLTCICYSVTDALVLRPLLVPEPERLVAVHELTPRGLKGGMSPATFLDFQRECRSFEVMGAYRWWTVNLTGNGQPERVQGFLVTPGLFTALGVKAALGRTLQPEDEALERPVVVLSHRLWQNRFAGDPQIVGRSVQLSGRAYEVVGVMPPELLFPLTAELWAPLLLDAAERGQRGMRTVQAIARLKPEVATDQAQAELQTVASRIAAQYPQTNEGWSAAVRLVRDEISGDATRQYTLLTVGAFAFVLLIVCANVANMQLARGPARTREMAVRIAMGSGRWRIVRQLLAESTVLALAGILPSLLLALWGTDLMRVSMPAEVEKFLPGWQRLRVHGGVVGFSVLAALVSGLLAGIVPALQLSLPNIGTALKDGGRGGAARGQHRLRSLLVVGEVSLALTLLIGATLLIQGFVALGRWSPDLQPASVLTFRTALPADTYSANHHLTAFYDQVLAKLNALPRARAALVSSVPYGWSRNNGPISLEGRPAAPAELRNVQLQSVSPSYFEVLHVPVQDGRAFGEGDGPDAPAVAIVSRRFAEYYWPGESPLGKRLKVGAADSKNPWLTVVGVTGNVVHDWTERVPRPVLYRPYTQAPSRETDVVLRAAGDPLTMVPDVRAAVSALDPNLPIYDVRTFAKVISDSLVGFTYTAVMLAVAGALAALLSAVGVYAVMANAVAERTHEIGVRMALGARANDVLAWILRRGLALGIAGLAIGLTGAYVLARLLSDLLMGVDPTNPLLFSAAGALLLAVLLAASYFPARRASHVDPMVALRYE